MSDAGVPTFDQAAGPQAGIFTPDAPAAPAEEKPVVDITRLKKMFDDCRTTPTVLDSRKVSDTCRDYFDGYQLTAEERAVLQKRGQPEVETNRIRGAINGILGVVEMGKTDPRALMRNPDASAAPAPQVPQGPGAPSQPQQPTPVAPAQGPQTQQIGQPRPGQQVMGGNGGPPMAAPPLDAADVATMTLRYIADTTHFQTTKMDALENILIEGTGAAIFEVDGQNVLASQIRWEEFFYDPRSRRNDFKDARYMGVAKWMYADYLAAIYPAQAEALNGFATSGAIDGLGFDMSWEDRPEIATPWFDRNQRRLMVVEIYYIEGQTWNRAVFYAGGELEAGPSPYKDDNGRPMCPIEAVSAYVDRRNKRYGIVKDMLPIQDEITMRRSKALHEMNTRQVQQTDATAPQVDVESVREEAAKADGVIPPGWNVVARSDVVANNLTMLAEAKSEIERFSPNPAILGRQGADASGRSQQIRQQAGMTELARVLGRFNDWEYRCYSQMWSRARQFWSDPKWVRVTDDTGAPQYVRINDPVHAQDPTTGQPVVDPATGQPQRIDTKNDIAKMDIDIEIDSVPDTTTLEQEIFAELSHLAQTYGPQNVPFTLVLEMSSLPKKRELIQKLEAFQQQQAQAQSQALAQKGASEQAKAQADVAQTIATAKNKEAQAGLFEVQSVVQALEGHLQANAASVQLPPGIADGAHAVPPQQVMPPPGGAQAPQPTAPTGVPAQ